MPITVTTITPDDARRIIAAREGRAGEPDVPVNIAVVDAGGAHAAFVRMDGAWPGNVDIVIGKASTARAFDIATAALAG